MALPAVMDMIHRMNLGAEVPRYSATYPLPQDHGSRSIFVRNRNKENPTEKIIIFACDTTDVAEGREIDIEGWEVKIKGGVGPVHHLNLKLGTIPWLHLQLLILGFPGSGEYHQDDCQSDCCQYE